MRCIGRATTGGGRESAALMVPHVVVRPRPVFVRVAPGGVVQPSLQDRARAGEGGDAAGCAPPAFLVAEVANCIDVCSAAYLSRVSQDL